MSYNKHLAALLVLCITVGLVYANAAGGTFHYDDFPNIVNNPAIRTLNLWTDIGGSRYVTDYLSFATNYALFGSSPASFHIINIAIHAMNAMLVYWLILALYAAFSRSANTDEETQTTLSWYAAAATACLFAVHPIQTEAVDYVYQRVAELAALFYLLSVSAFVSSRLTVSPVRKWIYFCLSFFAAILAMKSKENAFTLPFVILLMEFVLFRATLIRERWPAYLFLLLLPIIPLSHIDAVRGHDYGPARGAAGLSRADYLATELRVLVTYLRLVFAPIAQNADYDYPIFHSFLAWPVLASAVLLAVLGIFGAIALWRGSKWSPYLGLAGLGTVWFFLTLSVESSVVPLSNVIEEYRLYLPITGILLAATAFGSLLIERWYWVRKNAWGVGLLVAGTIAAAGAAAHARNDIWRSDITLWSDVVSKAPNKIRGHINLGVAYLDANNVSAAGEEFTKVLSIDANNADALTNLGTILLGEGNAGEAAAYLAEAAKSNPNSAAVHSDLGRAYEQLRRLEEAHTEYAIAVDLAPNSALLHSNLGAAAEKLNSLGEASAELKTSIQLDSRNYIAWTNLGVVQQRLGKLDDAIADYQAALRLNSDYDAALYHIGIAYLVKSDYKDGVINLQQYLQMRPQDFGAKYSLAVALYKDGQSAAAREITRQMLAIKPGDPQVEQLDSLLRR